MTFLLVSLRVVSLALVFVIPLGTWLGWILARWQLRARAVLDAIVLFPLVLPPSVVGYGLLLLFGRQGPVGVLLEHLFGVRLVFSTVGAALAAGVVSLPFMAKGAEVAFSQVDRRYEEQAAVVGLSPHRVFAWVTLPLAARGLIAAVVLVALRALGEFGATITFAGYLPGVTSTAPLAVYMAYQAGDDALALHLVICLAVVAQIAALVVAFATRRPRERAMNALLVETVIARGAFSLDVAFEANPGVTVLFGPSACGKTLTLRAIAGLISPQGRVVLGDRDLIRVPTHERGIGYAPQEAVLWPHRTVRDHVEPFATSERVRFLTESLDLGRLWHRRPGDLSGGEQRRVALARALAREARLLLLDEPLSALDLTARVALGERIRAEARRRGTVVLLVTHDILEARTLGDALVRYSPPASGKAGFFARAAPLDSLDAIIHPTPAE